MKKMGYRISYEISKDESPFFELLVKHYSKCREWLIEMYYEELIEYNNETYSEDLFKFLENNQTLNFSKGINQNLFDELTKEFINSYCDYGEGLKIFRFIDPSISLRKYEGSSALIDNHLDEKSQKLWKYIFKGRSFLNDKEFLSSDEIKIGYWKPKEWKHLSDSIKSTFGDFEVIKKKYWTEEEKEKFNVARQKAIERNVTFSISHHNPISTGLECFLQMVRGLPNEEIEVIFTLG